MRRLQVALVSPYDFSVFGGVNEHIRHLARHLRLRGHSVEILAPSSSDTPSEEEGVVLLGKGIVPVPFGGAIARISLSPHVWGEVQHLLRNRRYDIIHLHEPTTPAVCPAVLYHSESVNVGTFHQYKETHVGYEIANRIASHFVEKLHGRIAVSRAARDFITSYFPGEYRLIPNGIEVATFGDPKLLPWEEYCTDGKLNILFVGRMERRKGLRYLLRAFRLVKEAIPEARLLVVGAYDKEDRVPFVRYVRHFHIRDVKFIGPVSTVDKARWYKTAHIFCAPSTGGESFGIVLTEAMAAGAPVVASDIPGYRSVIRDRVTGVLVPPEDEEALAIALIRLLRDPARRQRLRDAARPAVRRYDWSVVSEQIESYYYELLGCSTTVMRDA
ncbi:MAG: glycosyltransferase family 4 protein [Ardenticatenaceae bacterium]